MRQSLAEPNRASVQRGGHPLRRDVPVGVDPAEAALGGWDIEELRRLFDFLEFRTLWDRFLEATGNGERGAARGRRRGALSSPRWRSRLTATAAIRRITGWARRRGLAVAAAWEGRGAGHRSRGLAFAPLPPGAGPVEVVVFGEAVLDDPGGAGRAPDW